MAVSRKTAGKKKPVSTMDMAKNKLKVYKEKGGQSGFIKIGNHGQKKSYPRYIGYISVIILASKVNLLTTFFVFLASFFYVVVYTLVAAIARTPAKYKLVPPGYFYHSIIGHVDLAIVGFFLTFMPCFSRRKYHA